jgi:hypothetical protein
VVFFGWFGFNLVTLSNSCISNVCRDVPLIDGNLYVTVIHWILPFFAILSLVRVGLNFYGNQRDKAVHSSFYLSLCLLLACYLGFAYNSKEFFYFYWTDNVHLDSDQVMYILFLFGITSLLLFKDKKSWDASTFFVKSRIINYIFHLIIMLMNLRVGVLTFALFVPFLIISDLTKRTHYNWEEKK